MIGGIDAVRRAEGAEQLGRQLEIDHVDHLVATDAELTASTPHDNGVPFAVVAVCRLYRRGYLPAPALAVCFMRFIDRHKSAGIVFVDDFHQGRIFSDIKGYDNHFFLRARIGTHRVHDRSGSHHLPDHLRRNRLGIRRNDMRHVSAGTSDKYLIDNDGADKGGYDTQQGQDNIIDRKHTQNHHDRVDRKDHARAFQLFEYL